ncbi:MAG: hypothetical protein Q9222_000175 [Ikaeria aurantiellina]
MDDTDRLRILLIGNGGREHALAWKLSQSPRVDSIYVVPGNAGTARALKNVENVETVKADDFPALVAFAKENKVNLVVPGPEVPLVNGIELHFRKAGIRCFGPTEKAARMEGSKTFAKDFMLRWNIPTADYRNFSDFGSARSYLGSVGHKVVLKANGLAAGKGVIVPSSHEEAHVALENIMLHKEFGAAGEEVVIEEYLEGEELSFLTFCDGHTLRTLPPAQDHKAVFDGDRGPRGMGCYGPAPVATPQLIDEVHRTILEPTIHGMCMERYPFVGLLFTGIMLTKSGPKVLEYNVRFGDPETQTLLPLLKADTDLAEIMLGCTDQWLKSVRIDIEPKFSTTVVAAAGGYPGTYARDHVITIDLLSEGQSSADRIIFHAGTKLSEDTPKTAGGRVIAATSIATTLEDAIAGSYSLMSTIHFKEMHYRTDIGQRALRRRKGSSNGHAMSYTDAGVTIAAGNALIGRIKSMVASTARPGASATIGGFGGVIDVDAAGLGDVSSHGQQLVVYPLLTTLTLAQYWVSTTDGVGTKLLVAHAMKKHDTIGIDLVAMNVNDLVVQGAKPLSFLDCYSTGSLDVNTAEQVIKGVVAGCTEAGCALVGGETAEIGGILPKDGGIYDINGTANGFIAKGKQLLPNTAEMMAGDVLLGLASSGCHSNGFTLIRKIVEERAGLRYTDPSPWSNGELVGESLLTPTRIYVKSIQAATEKDLIKGMAHITGGGLTDNVPRMLPEHLAAVLDASTWKVPEVMKWLKKTGNISNVSISGRLYAELVPFSVQQPVWSTLYMIWYSSGLMQNTDFESI